LYEQSIGSGPPGNVGQYIASQPEAKIFS